MQILILKIKIKEQSCCGFNSNSNTTFFELEGQIVKESYNHSNLIQKLKCIPKLSNPCNQRLRRHFYLTDLNAVFKYWHLSSWRGVFCRPSMSILLECLQPSELLFRSSNSKFEKNAWRHSWKSYFQKFTFFQQHLQPFWHITNITEWPRK